MDGVAAALMYSLFLSIIYRIIASALSDRLSSAEGFTLTYLVAIYVPIYISLARISLLAPFILLLFQALLTIYLIFSSGRRAKYLIATTNIYTSIALSTLLLIARASRIL